MFSISDIPNSARILTTTVGSHSQIAWLLAYPTEQAVADATRVIFDIQTKAGIDLPTDGELYRFDPNHPDTNGMIEYFTGKFSGIRNDSGRSDWIEFTQNQVLKFRNKPSGVVENEIGEGSLNLLEDCQRAADIARGPFKFTLTSPYMLARTLLDKYYNNFENLLYAIAEVLADQVSDLPCSCIQIDEANIPGNPADTEIAANAINIILDKINVEKSVHLCFGNYGGQTIQKGHWDKLITFLNSLNTDHLILETAKWPENETAVLKDIDSEIQLGMGVIDIKVNHVETPDEIARQIENFEKVLGTGRIRWVHPDCGFWMLKRSVAERKIEALIKGRDKYLGIC